MGLPGLTTRLTSDEIPVVRFHYSADSKKRPGTPQGDVWLAEAVRGYPGGSKSPRWAKEQEIDYAALGGTRLFPEWPQWAEAGKIVIPPFTPEGWRLYGSYDHGWRNPSCYLIHGINFDGDITTLWEFYAPGVPIGYIAKIIRGEAVALHDGRRFEGNPFAGQETYKIADPAIWSEDQPTSDNTYKSVYEAFRDNDVLFNKGERGGDSTVASWLLGWFWANPDAPRYRITQACPKLIWELGQQRYKEFSARVALNRDQPEELVDKDNHAYDALKYFMRRFPPPAKKPTPPAPSATFQWWKRQQVAVQHGQAPRSFKVQLRRIADG